LFRIGGRPANTRIFAEIATLFSISSEMLKRNSTFEKAYKIKGIALKNLNKEKANAEKAIGNKYFREKKFKLAIEKYEDIIEKYGSDITLFNNIATCYFKLGQEDSHNFVISREMSVKVNSF
jgi:tetratricopeptide (TPR) repeat protein